MDVIIIMCLGIFVGNRVRRFSPRHFKSTNEYLQILCTLALIFFMGISLGQRPGFLLELSGLGLQSLAFCLLPVLFSVILVYVLTHRFLESEKEHKKDGAKS